MGALCELIPVHSFGYCCTFELFAVRVLLSVATYGHCCLCLFVNLYTFLLGVFLGVESLGQEVSVVQFSEAAVLLLSCQR